MRGWVSGIVLLGLGAGLGWLGVAELHGVFAGGAGAAAQAVLGAMIAFVPASVFFGLGLFSLRRSMKIERDAVEALTVFQDPAPPMAVVIPFPGGRFRRP